jgi:hypothetical protein
MNWKVPVYSQRTLNLCWEACARMLWGWKYKNTPASMSNYIQKAGAYATLSQGLTEQQMDTFYRRLGMRSLRNPSGKNIRHALKWSPVIANQIKHQPWHALVVIGFNNRKYKIINPCGVEVVSFDQTGGDSCTASSSLIQESILENELGKYIWYW